MGLPNLQFLGDTQMMRMRREAMAHFLSAPTVVNAAEYLNLHESQERPHCVIAMLKAMSAEAVGSIFWKLMATEWMSFDAIPHVGFSRLFKAHRTRWSKDCMSVEDQIAYDVLPSGISVFRGQDAGQAVGLSWTVDRNVAEDFARGHRLFRNPNPIVLCRRIRKSSVALFAGERGESEIVLFSRPQWQPRLYRSPQPSAQGVDEYL